MAYIGKQPTVGNFVKLDSITTSATATYNLLNGGVAYSPQSANHCIVSLNGVIQEPTSASNVGGFTISGSTIVFTSALTATDVIDFILVLGDVLNIGTPSDATVGFAKVTSNLITGATAVTAPATDDVLLCYDTSATALRKITFANFGSTPAFSAYRSGTDQTITAGSDTTVQYNSEFFDTGNCYSTSTYKFIPNVAGKYFLQGSIGLTAGTNEVRYELYIVKNGNIAKKTRSHISGNNPITLSVSGIVEANGTTDEFYVQFYYASGTSNVFGSTTPEKESFFEGYRLIGV